MASRAAKVIAAAHSQIGYHEGRSGGHWNNKEKYAADVPGLAWANYQPWCDTFVAWCFWKAGALKYLPGGATASTVQTLANAKAHKRFSEYPAIGAQVIFGHGHPQHTGLVVDYGPDTITTIEGNTNDSGSPEGDGVYLKTRRRRDSFVIGYLYPEYPEGIQSADPAWQHAKPKHNPAIPRTRKDVVLVRQVIKPWTQKGRRGMVRAAAIAFDRQLARIEKTR